MINDNNIQTMSASQSVEELFKTIRKLFGKIGVHNIDAIRAMILDYIVSIEYDKISAKNMLMHMDAATADAFATVVLNTTKTAPFDEAILKRVNANIFNVGFCYNWIECMFDYVKQLFCTFTNATDVNTIFAYGQLIVAISLTVNAVLGYIESSCLDAIICVRFKMLDDGIAAQVENMYQRIDNAIKILTRMDSHLPSVYCDETVYASMVSIAQIIDVGRKIDTTLDQIRACIR